MFCMVKLWFEFFEYYPYIQMWQYNVPTKYQLHTSYGFRDIAWTRFYKSRSQRQGQRSNQGHTMTLQGV